jgi:hypothetical protein
MAAPEGMRARLLHDLNAELGKLSDDAFRWTPECVYVIALKE